MNQHAKFAPLTEAERAAQPAPAPNNRLGSLVLPVPLEAPAIPETHPKHGRPAATWPYKNASGAVLHHVCRFDPPGGKQVLPLTLWHDETGLRWNWKAIADNRPLYGLDRLAACPEAPVVIVEGEQCADAASRIFPDCACITSSGGSHAAAKTDWQMLAGRKILIWPDCDDPGRKYAETVAAILHQIGCIVSVVDAQKLASMSPAGGTREPAKGWDCADALQEWRDIPALRAAVLEAVKADQRQPGYLSHGAFTMDGSGLHLEVTKRRGANASTESEWICAPLEVLGACRDPQGHEWGKWLRWRDNDKRVHARHVADASLQGDAASLCGVLAGDGLSINRNQQRAFASYLSACQPQGRVTLVLRTGWHDLGAHRVFVLPGGTIGPVGSEHVILDASATGPYEAKGNLADWQAGIGKLASGHALPVLAISTALAGPLLHLAGQESGGLHIFGGSSKGKTTLLQAAASVWGRGSSPGFVRAWRATANGLEGAAASATDTVLVLDELGMVEAREAAGAIYGLSNGAGKQRAGRTGDLREPKSWRVLFLSSGEIPVEGKLTEERGRKARAGQLVRMLDVPADRGAGFGAFDSGGPDGDAAALSKAFKHAAITHYGSAGPEFVRRIIDQGAAETGEAVRQSVAGFVAANLPAGADGQIDRAAQRFGLIAAAGELATLLGVTPWQNGEARTAAAWALAQWIEGRGGSEPMEARQAVEQVRGIIEKHGETRFDSLGDSAAQHVQNRLGWKRGTGLERQWLIPAESWKNEFCAGLDATFVAKTLCELGMLVRGADQFASVVKIAGHSTKVRILTASILQGGDNGE